MKKSIHVIEDDVDIGELIAFLLTEQGYDVLVFSKVSVFRNHMLNHPLPALIIVDVMLPDGNGLDICQEWKADRSTRHIPILLMSAYEDFKNDAKACHASGFISKPFDIGKFLNEVQKHID